MDRIATRPHPLESQTGQPLKAKPCQCENPLADPRDLCCVWCGHQVGGVPLPVGPRRSHLDARDAGEAPPPQRRTVTILGLDVLPLPNGYTPLEATAVIKALDEEGCVSLLIRSTDGLNAWESLGMLDAAVATTRDSLVSVFEDEGPEEDEDE
jgi:hypothetical protein